MSKVISIDDVKRVMKVMEDRLENSRKESVAAKCTASNFIALNMDVDSGKLIEPSRRTFAQAYGGELAYGHAKAELSYAISSLEKEAL